MILLELTEKEVNFLKEVIGLEKTSVSESSIGFAEQERKTGICNSFLAKVEEACKPKEDVLITNKDLFFIKDLTHTVYKGLRAELKISQQPVEQKDFVHISLASAVIMWLNSRGLLKRVAKFDFTDDSFGYEGIEE